MRWLVRLRIAWVCWLIASVQPASAAARRSSRRPRISRRSPRRSGGDKVTVETMARGYQDPHFVEPKPSFILKLHAADLLVVVGRELEIGWLPPLVQQSRNAKIQPGAPGVPRCVPYREDSRHSDGADHPRDGRRAPARQPALLARPGQRPPNRQGDPGQTHRSSRQADGAYFAGRYADFDTRLAEAEKRWDAALAPYKGAKIVTYHRSWPNFAERFGLDVVGYVEPKPGIPPSPGHTLDLMNEMKRQNIKVIAVEPYFDLKTPNAVARDTGAVVLVLAPSVGGVKEATDYMRLFDYNVNLLVQTFQKLGVK